MKSEERVALIPGLVHVGIEVIERSQSLAIGIAHDLRIEVRGAIDGAFDLTETLLRSAIRFGKKTTQRVDESVAAVTNRLDRLVADGARSARDVTRAGESLASSTASAIVGVDRQPAPAAHA